MEYLIKNTTKEQRKKIAKDAFGISIGSGEHPTSETIELVKEYIEGKKELEEIKNIIIGRYKK